mmetsp:Transcript_4833/g.16577  ORF Transcript_4833/g.16577 Transcript_4833/m.16577 type:complete len:306 (+) Transcript_4833:57-974(+)
MIDSKLYEPPLVAVVFRRRPRSSSFCNSFCPPLFSFSLSVSLSLCLSPLSIPLSFVLYSYPSRRLRAFGGLQKRIDRFTQRVDDETNLAQVRVVQDISPVEHKRRFVHDFVDSSPVVRLELVPFGHDGHGVRVLQRLRRLRVARDALHSFFAHVHSDLFFRHLRVKQRNLGTIFNHPMRDVNRRRFASIPGVLLERKAEHGNFLVTNGVEHGGNNSSHESGLLVIVHANDGVPVIGNFLQSVALANVRQVQDIFLKARTAETDRGVQKLRANSGIFTNRKGDLGNVRSGALAQRRDGVDGRNSLR